MVVETALHDAGVPANGLAFEDLVRIFQDRPLRPMQVEIPTEY